MRHARVATALALCVILLLALALRIHYYTGPIGSDDNSYFLAAHDIYEGAYRPSDLYWKNRYGMLLPIAASFQLFGTNEFAAAGWPMASALGAIVVCFFLGKTLIDTKTGLLACLLLAFYPLDIHYSGLILPDIPLSFLMAASVLSFIQAGRSPRYGPALFFLSGALLAVAYSCRSMALILLPFFLIYVVVFERRLRPAHGLVAAGFLSLIASEGFYYYMNGLSPLHNFELNRRAAIAVNSSGECSTSQLYYPTVIFQNASVFGAYFFLFLPAMALSAFKRERGPLILLAWAGSLLLILQFGFVSVSPFIQIVKVRKFLIFATVPLILLGAWALTKLRWRFGLAAVLVIVATSLYLLRPYSYKGNATPEASGSNMRGVAAFLEEAPPKPVYADPRSKAMLMLMSGFELKPDRFRNLYEVRSPQELKDCYVVINGFYARFDLTNPYASVPRFVARYPENVPASWKAVNFFPSVVLDVP